MTPGFYRFADFPTFCGVPAVPIDELDGAAKDVVILGADVVEVSPPYDGPGPITAFLANRVALEILSGMAERKLGG